MLGLCCKLCGEVQDRDCRSWRPSHAASISIRSVTKLHNFGENAGADSKSALDNAGLAQHVAREVEDRRLPFAQRPHHLKALDCRTGRLQRLETPHRADQLLQLAVVSLDDIVQVLDLADAGSVAKMRKRRLRPVGNPDFSNSSRSSSLVKIDLCNRAV